MERREGQLGFSSEKRTCSAKVPFCGSSGVVHRRVDAPLGRSPAGHYAMCLDFGASEVALGEEKSLGGEARCPASAQEHGAARSGAEAATSGPPPSQCLASVDSPSAPAA